MEALAHRFLLKNEGRASVAVDRLDWATMEARG